MDTLIIVIVAVIVVILLVLGGIIVYFVPFGLWVTAQFSAVRISIWQLIGMRLRRVEPKIIVEEMIKARKAGLTDVKINTLEAHHLAKGNISNVIDALISAKNADIVDLNFEKAAAIDLAGRDVLQAVRDSVNTKVIDAPPVEAVCKNGIQLIAKARVTVRCRIDKLIGGAGEETILARVGQGIVAAIGSAESHQDILADPGIISRRVMNEGFDLGLAYEVLAIDIADVDIGKSIGAELKADEAEADLKIARAKAEEKRADAVADEQHFRAKVQEMRAKLIESEAQIPLAIAEAFRMGNLGIMDYYRLRNMEADTRMRQSFSESDDRTDDESHTPLMP
ncbi:MAG: flotillin-like protein FloA [Bacteroidia bacterium]|nr:flotillin-like protein FloA [Bacteroidia bacterium]